MVVFLVFEKDLAIFFILVSQQFLEAFNHKILLINCCMFCFDSRVRLVRAVLWLGH